MNGTTSYALSKRYVAETAESLGSLKGAPCEIVGIDDIVDGEGNVIGNRVTFQWEGTSGTIQTDTMDVMNGTDVDMSQYSTKAGGYDDVTAQQIENIANTVFVGTLVTDITVSGSSAVTEGDTTQLTVTVLPSDATDKTVTWSSSDTSKATVDSTGLVTAISAGNVTITATANDGSGVAGTHAITVNAAVIPVSSITVSGSATVTAGNATQLSASVLPNNATDKTVTWSSSNDSYATVDSTGLVTGVAAGSVTITATAHDGSGVVGTHSLTVEAAVIPVSSITISGTNTVDVGSTTQLTTSVLPNDATDKTVTWSSNDTSLATVDSTGLVTGVGAGSVTITATANDGSGISGTYAVTVNSVVVPTISMQLLHNGTPVSNNHVLFSSESDQYSYTLEVTVDPPTAGDDADFYLYDATTSDPNVSEPLFVYDNDDLTGRVEPMTQGNSVIAGSVTIRAVLASDSSVTTEQRITVDPILVNSINLSDVPTSMRGGDTGELFDGSGWISPYYATYQYPDNFRAYSSNTDVLYVGYNGDMWTYDALSSGTATLTVEALDGGGATASVTITVS